MTVPLVGAILLAAMGANAATTNTPRVDFMLECQGCHRPEGVGLPSANVPTLKGHVSKFLHTSEGRAFLVRVPGVAQSSLSDERLAAVMNWMVEEFDPAHLPVNFRNYEAKEVNELRKKIMRNPNTIRRRILKASGFNPNDGYQ